MNPLSIAFGLAQFAPEVVRWLSGSDKAAEAAGKIVEIAETVTGRKGQDAVESIKTDPGMLLQFKHAVMLNEADLDKAFLADRSDARKRDIALAAAGMRNRRADYMVLLDVIGLIAGLIGMMVLGYVKAKHPNAITEGVFGALLAQLSTITSYFGLCLRDAHQFEFGSSRGSKEKDDAFFRSK
jgi:hypothetical protein